MLVLSLLSRVSCYLNYPNEETLSQTDTQSCFHGDSKVNKDEAVLPWDGIHPVKHEDKSEPIFFCPISYRFL